MILRNGVLLAALTFATLTPNSAQAMRFWWFDIQVDGKPAFAGGLGMSDRNSPLTVVRELRRAGIQLGSDSSLDKNTSGDVTLKGDVVFSFPDLPKLHFKQLRLIHKLDPFRDKGSVAGGYFDWHLHPDDAAMIIKRYESLNNDEAATSLTKEDGGAETTAVELPSMMEEAEDTEATEKVDTKLPAKTDASDFTRTYAGLSVLFVVVIAVALQMLRKGRRAV